MRSFEPGPGSYPDSATVPDSGTVPDTSAPELTSRVVATGLDNAFELLWGPDGTLWLTERTAGRVTRLDPDTGATATLLELDDVLITEGTQDGLLGMALDPSGEHVFLAWTYDADPGADVVSEVKLARYTVTGTGLAEPKLLIDGLPGSTDHNSGRLLYGPDDRLYYSIGDQGHNQFDYFCLPNHAQDLPTAAQVAAQDWSTYQGKVLRLELDGSIPADNPEIDGVQSHIYTYGHRNAQGLAFTAAGDLLEAEHGPKSDDEVNRLVAGGNYGWPHVAGYQDDLAYVYANWSASEDPPCDELEPSDLEIPPSVPQTEESAWSDPAFREPLRTFYTVADDHDFTDPACAENELYFICWPTIAPSSIAVHEGDSWLGDALLITSLKLGTLYRVPLDDGEVREGDAAPEVLFHTVDRFRRVTVSPDGERVYVATDLSGLAMGADGTPTDALTHLGAILELSVVE